MGESLAWILVDLPASRVRLVSALAVAPGEARAGSTGVFCRAHVSEMCLVA